MDKILFKRIEELKRTHEETHRNWLISVKSVEPILQKGPQCGLVALCMALNHKGLTCSPSQLFEISKELNFTRQGELFDIEYLERLAQNFNLKSKIVAYEHFITLCEYVVRNYFILMPYDCDANHEPCFKNGRKAHWCLIVGYMTPSHTNLIQIDSSHEDSSAFAHENFYVICMHGKSSFKTLWDVHDLVKSNQQLNEICNKILENSSDFVIPLKTLSQTLKSKFLVLF